MSLVWPAGLLFLLSLPLIVWLHSRRQRERQVVVPSITPWQALRAAIPPRRRKIPTSLLLLMHLTFAAVVAIAIASPLLPGPERTARDRAFVLDATTSMLAGDRWVDATDRVRELADETPGEITLVTLGPRPRVLIARDTSRDRFEAALAQVEPGGTGAEMAEAVALASAASAPEAEIVVVTDGSVAVADGLPVDRWENVGTDFANVAIETAGVETEGGLSQLFVRVASFGADPVEVPLTLQLDGREVDRLEAPVGPFGSFETVWTLPSAGGTASVSMNTGDALAADDELQIPLEPEVLRVELVGESDAVSRALSAMPHVDVTQAGSGTYRTDGTIDVTVFVGMAPDDLPPGGVLVFDPPPGKWSSSDNSTNETLVAEPAGHQLARGLDLAGARVGGAAVLDVPEGAAAVLEAAGEPVAFAGDVDGSHLIVFGFDADDGELASRLAFPLLVARAVEWAAPPRPPRIAQSGDVVPLPPGSHELRGPGVSERGVRESFETTGRPGLYSATSIRGTEPRVTRFAVGAGDAAESDLRSVSEMPEAVASAAALLATDSWPVWPWLVAAALVVAVVETLWRGSGDRRGTGGRL